MDYAAARRNMVESQLRPNKVTDAALLDVLATLPRERFVPAPMQNVAYVDDDIPLGRGRFLMEPMVLARLLQLATIRPTDAALVVGAATGYTAAVMSRLAGRVIALESDALFAASAKDALAALDIANAAIVEGPLTAGAPRQAPYDVIVFDGSIDEIPAGIIDQLGENGRLVAVLNKDRVGRATLLMRSRGVVAGRTAFDAAVPRLPGFEAAPVFSF
jgi:protein-L-isoaspartate(D-aspartate) O-methyltransferase